MPFPVEHQLGKRSSFLKTGWNGDCLSQFLLAFLNLWPFCLKKRGRILVSLGIKFFLLIPIPWGTACEQVTFFFLFFFLFFFFFLAYNRVLTLFSFVIMREFNWRSYCKYFSTALSTYLLSMNQGCTAVLYQSKTWNHRHLNPEEKGSRYCTILFSMENMSLSQT